MKQRSTTPPRHAAGAAARLLLPVLALIVGLGGAAYIALRAEPLHRSEAVLLFRHARPADAAGDVEAARTEMEILTSFDLAGEVATAVGAERLAPDQSGSGDAGLAAAAAALRQGLEVEPRPQSGLIRVAFSHPDVRLPAVVLDELIDRYFRKHLEIHRGSPAAGMAEGPAATPAVPNISLVQSPSQAVRVNDRARFGQAAAWAMGAVLVALLSFVVGLVLHGRSRPAGTAVRG